jgi:hypothetical protein
MYINIVTCRVVRETKIMILDRIIGFLGTSVTISLNYDQYSAIGFTQFTVHRYTRTRILNLH